MADPFIGEIRAFAHTFPQDGWFMCDGAAYKIASYTSLFSVIQTIFGGNGTTEFAVPFIAGRALMGVGSGSGLSPRSLADTGGNPLAYLNADNLPAHKHLAFADVFDVANLQDPSPARCMAQTQDYSPYENDGPTQSYRLDPNALLTVGDGQPHEHAAVPCAQLRIAWKGLFP